MEDDGRRAAPSATCRGLFSITYWRASFGGIVALVGGLALWRVHEGHEYEPIIEPIIIVDGYSCPPRPTVALAFDPADEQRLAAHATDIFVGQAVAAVTGPEPASPVPDAPPNVVVPLHVAVAVLRTEKGTATGTVVVHQAFQHGIEGCHHGVSGDVEVEVGDVLRFVTVRDDPTGTYSLFAGPCSHRSATPQPLPFQTAMTGH